MAVAARDRCHGLYPWFRQEFIFTRRHDGQPKRRKGSLSDNHRINGRDGRRNWLMIILQYNTSQVRSLGGITTCSPPAGPCPSPCGHPLIARQPGQVGVRNKIPTSDLLGGIALEGSNHLIEGTGGDIHRALNVALRLGLLVLDVALGLTLLARRLPRVEAGRVANRLLHLSGGVLDVAGSLAVNERNVSTGDDAVRGGGVG